MELDKRNKRIINMKYLNNNQRESHGPEKAGGHFTT